MTMQANLKQRVSAPDATLICTVMDLFVDLLVASGARVETIRQAAEEATSRASSKNQVVSCSHLGPVLRDCMEVMCAWRRHAEFVNSMGEPLPLDQGPGSSSFSSLCRKARCKSDEETILQTLLEFGAVSMDDAKRVVSSTPTFLAGNSAAGLLAVDGVVHQLAGFLQVVHRNVCSVTGAGSTRFERACSVKVAAELEPVFDQLVRGRGQEFIDSIDEWLERNAKYVSPSGSYVEMGAGAYFINFEHSLARSII